MSWMSRSWLKSASTAPKTSALADHADQQHDVEERDDARARCFGREIGGEREAGGLRRMQAGADEEERQRGCHIADPDRAVRVAGQHDQCERHDGEAAELQQRAEPDVGHAAPAEHRAMRVGAEADQGAERREDERQRHHQRDERSSARRVR